MGKPKRKQKPAQPPPRKTVVNTDVLTGQYLDAALPTWYLDGDMSRPAHVRAPIPTRIHTQQTETPRRDYHDDDATAKGLGGKQFTSAFDRYMLHVLPRIIAEEQQTWLAWWDVEYVTGRIRKRLGSETLEIALAVLRDGRSISNVARDYQRSPTWITYHTRKVTLMAEAYFTHRSRGYRKPAAE